MINHRKPIDKLMDCQHVKRWNLVATTIESNVASHSFNVAVLAMAINNRMRNVGDTNEMEICYHAIMHDVDEAETGDMPTPTKAALREAGVNPNALYPTQGKVQPPSAKVRQIIKLADLLENFSFISEYGAGTRARAAAAEVRGRLDEAIGGASEDMADAARWVLAYVQQRRSDEEGERSRFAEDNKRSDTAISFPVPSVMGRVPRHSTGST